MLCVNLRPDRAQAPPQARELKSPHSAVGFDLTHKRKPRIVNSKKGSSYHILKRVPARTPGDSPLSSILPELSYRQRGQTLSSQLLRFIRSIINIPALMGEHVAICLK